MSIDWLLGLSQSDETITEVAPVSTVEVGFHGTEDSPLVKWHQEAEGYKIRYSPGSLPDALRTKAVTEYEFGKQKHAQVDVKSSHTETQLEYHRLPETDIEVVMPVQRLQNLASGTDIWANLCLLYTSPSPRDS